MALCAYALIVMVNAKLLLNSDNEINHLVTV
jgi:hypothetical protein